MVQELFNGAGANLFVLLTGHGQVISLWCRNH